MNEQNNISFEKIILRFLAGIGGAIIGSSIIFGISVFSLDLLAPITNLEKTDYSIPAFIFFIIVLIFITTTVANLLSTFFLLLTEKNLLNKKKLIFQTLVMNIIVFALSIPAYIVLIFTSPAYSVLSASFHMCVASAITAVIVFDTLHPLNKKSFSVGIILSFLLSATILIFINNLIPGSTIILFTALPVIWGSIIFTAYLFLGLYLAISGIYKSESSISEISADK